MLDLLTFVACGLVCRWILNLRFAGRESLTMFDDNGSTASFRIRLALLSFAVVVHVLFMIPKWLHASTAIP